MNRGAAEHQIKQPTGKGVFDVSSHSSRTWIVTLMLVVAAGSAFAQPGVNPAPARTPNTPPRASIASPRDNSSYVVGTMVSLMGTATDAEDRDARLTYQWDVDAVRDGATPVRVLSFKGKNATFVPEQTEQVGTRYEIRLVVTDSGALRDTAAVRLVPGPVPARAEESSYPLGSGDRVHVAIYAGGEKQEDFTGEVSPSGTLTSPLIGEIPVRGITAFEVSNHMREILSRDFFVDPQVLVSVNNFARKVFVSGEVKNPGGYSVQEGLTVLSACTLAGGFTDYASLKRVKLLRTENGRMRTIDIDLSKVRRGKSPDISVMAGDRIDVPHRRY